MYQIVCTNVQQIMYKCTPTLYKCTKEMRQMAETIHISVSHKVKEDLEREHKQLNTGREKEIGWSEFAEEILREGLAKHQQKIRGETNGQHHTI